MRAVRNDLGLDVDFTLLDAYSRVIATFSVSKDKSARLPIFKPREYLVDSRAQHYYIYAGEGEIKLSECKKYYDLRHIDIKELDYYCQKGKFKPKTCHKQAIKDFCEIFEINAHKGCYFIAPAHFEEVEYALLYGNSTCLRAYF